MPTDCQAQFKSTAVGFCSHFKKRTRKMTSSFSQPQARCQEPKISLPQAEMISSPPWSWSSESRALKILWWATSSLSFLLHLFLNLIQNFQHLLHSTHWAYAGLTQKACSEIQHRHLVAAGVQDVVLIANHFFCAANPSGLRVIWGLLKRHMGPKQHINLCICTQWNCHKFSKCTEQK